MLYQTIEEKANMMCRQMMRTLPLCIAGIGLPLSSAMAEDVATLPSVTVQGKPDTGTAEEGYKSSDVELGQLGPIRIQDAPYSANVVPAELIQNTQASSLVDAVKYMPSVQRSDYGSGGAGPGSGNGRLQTRGFVSATHQNTRLDGMVAWIFPLPMEGYDRLEILNGLTGTIYGSGNPAGTFNLVQKRPSRTADAELSAGYRRSNMWQGYADVNSGEFSNGISLRATGLFQNGEGWSSDSHLGREFASLAMDWRINPGTVLEANIMHAKQAESGFAGNFYYRQNALGQAQVRVPDPIGPTNAGYGQNLIRSDVRNDTASLRLKHRLNENWNVVIGGLFESNDIFAPRYYHTMLNNAGDYTTMITHAPVEAFRSNANTFALTGLVTAYGMQHDLVLASNGYYIKSLILDRWPNELAGNSNIYNPVRYPTINFPYQQKTHLGTLQQGQNLIFSDMVTFNDRWKLLLNGNQAWFKQTVYNSPFSLPGTVRDNGLSAAASLIFKPRTDITTYLSYSNSLQQGDIAPATAVNAYALMAPYRSTQYEAGVKFPLLDLDVTTNVFRIKRPFANTDAAGVYRLVGNQVHEGLEVFASGKPTKQWGIYGGVTLMNPKMKNTGIPSTNNRDVVGIPKVQANLLAEYAMPTIPGLTLGANLHHTGKGAADNANSAYISSYTTLDLHMRYVVKGMAGKETVFRLAVNNVTNRRYWATVLPSNLVGGATGTYSLTAGSPLDVVASVSVRF